MMKNTLLIVALLIAMTGFSQSKFAISLNGAFDQNNHHLTDLRKLNTNEMADFSGGVNLIYYLGEKFRLRAEMEYSNVSFSRDYQTDPTVAKNVAYTNIAMNNLSLNPHLDYKLFSLSKLDVYASGGVRFEFGFYEWQNSFNQGGDLLSGKYINEVQTGGNSGAIGGLSFKYNLTEHLGLNFSPEYTYFFKPFYTANEFNFQRISMKAGLEWRF
ncbi:MAG: outer membrane beta-barrel protein [Prolixibacteraceae bacterium]